MRLVKCDNCSEMDEMPRNYYTTYPEKFRKLEFDRQMWEFCSKECELAYLIKLAENNK